MAEFGVERAATDWLRWLGQNAGSSLTTRTVFGQKPLGTAAVDAVVYGDADAFHAGVASLVPAASADASAAAWAFRHERRTLPGGAPATGAALSGKWLAGGDAYPRVCVDRSVPEARESAPDVGGWVLRTDRGTVRLEAPCRFRGEVGDSNHELFWHFEPSRKGAGIQWVALLPSAPARPPRWIGIEATLPLVSWEGRLGISETGGEGHHEERSSKGLVVVRGGSALPSAWAIAVAGRWEPGRGCSTETAAAAPSVAVAGCWVKMGRLGVLGLPVPKTFFVLDLPFGDDYLEGVSSRARSVTRLDRTSALRAVVNSSFVKFPVWEARIPTRNWVVTVRFEFDSLHRFQHRFLDPEGVGVFRAVTPFGRGRLWVERRICGRYIGVGVYETDSAYLEFGGHRALPCLPLDAAFGYLDGRLS